MTGDDLIVNKDEKNKEKQLQNKEENWSKTYSYFDLPREVLDWIEANSNDVITVSDMEGEIIFISNSVKKMLGYRPDYVVGSIVGDFLSPYDQQLLLSRLNKLGDEKQKFRFHIRDIEGKFIWTETDVSILKLETRRENVIVGITRDITERKEVEEMMVRSEKLSVAGQLAAGIAHEIRNPLTSLKGFLQLLQSGIESKSNYYKIMEEELQKIETITSELLFISKPMTDEKKPEKVSNLIKDVIVLFSSEAKMTGIEIFLNVIDDPWVICDRSQIKQVLINLLKNGIESMENGGRIDINVSENPGRNLCIIDVIDEGTGISSDIIHKLTEPFFTTKKNGTGLGLMITNEIIQRHGGRLDIFFPEEKKGSHFQVSLPLDE